tara:strand:+ start:782 stop:1852 length:1071 start_codon:yes stop_codon:yes gene_type:complete
MRLRLRLVSVVAIALALCVSPTLASDVDETFEPPSKSARRSSSSGRVPDRSEVPSSDTKDDPTNQLATARAGGTRERVVEEISFVLEHALTVVPGDATGCWEPAGVFSGKAHFTFSERSGENENDEAGESDQQQHSAARLSHLKLERDPLTHDFIEKFNYLSENDLPYRIALPANVLHPRRDEKVIAFLPAKCLAESGLQENFALHMDENGNVVGVDYDPAGGECHLEDRGAKLSSDPHFASTVSVRFYKTAPTLDPHAPTDVRGHGGPAGKKEREAKQRRSANGGTTKGDQKEEPEKTFWQKNWMYIVPVMMLLSNLVAPPAASSGGGRDGRSRVEGGGMTVIYARFFCTFNQIE